MQITLYGKVKTVITGLSAAILTLGLIGTANAQPPGVNDDTITLGTLQPLTGVFAAGAKAQLAGARAYWGNINANGGVCDGRQVKLMPRDTHYNPRKTVVAYSDINNRIFAIQLLTGTPTAEAVSPRLARDGVTAVEMGFSPALLGDESILIPGTTYDVDMVNAVDYLIQTGVLSQGDSVGYIYFQGDFGGAGLKGAEYAAGRNDIRVLPFQVNPGVGSVSSQVDKMVSKGVKAIFMSTSPALVANAATVSHTKGLDVPIVVPMPSFDPVLMTSTAADQIDGRVIVTTSYNAWAADSGPMDQLRGSYADSGQSAPPQQFVIAGYTAAHMMHEALHAICANGNLNRQALRNAFKSMESFDVSGLAVDLSYADRAMPPSLSNYILVADEDAIGGLQQVDDVDVPFQGKHVQAYVDQNK